MPAVSDLIHQLNAALAGRYTVERELGRGGMATVYLAHDPRHERRVALKFLNPELAASLGPARFLQEIRLAAGLVHPHILPVYDSGDAGGLLYYVMPVVEGESLRDRLRREKQLPVEEAVQITRQIADALAYAHGRGVLHRDLKPENILFEAGHAILSDFGIARAVTAAGGPHLTQTGFLVGTPTYMSPEQGSGAQQLDGRSDIYSLGCVLYEMLEGKAPFTGMTAMEVLLRHSTDPVPPLRARSGVPHTVKDALLRALAKAPANRFETATQFAEALRKGPSGESNVRERRRRRRFVALLALLLPPVFAAAANAVLSTTVRDTIVT